VLSPANSMTSSGTGHSFIHSLHCLSHNQAAQDNLQRVRSACCGSTEAA
jgi:hypothetical protein